MPESPSAVFTPWANFYVITGSSAAALTGLMFVVVTLVAGGRSQTSREGFSVFSTPTVVHFCAAFLVSTVMSAPWRSLAQPAIILAIAGGIGVVYSIRVLYRIRKTQVDYNPDIEDWTWYIVLPALAYLTVAVSAFYILSQATNALFALAGATLLIIFIGIHNAWDVVTYLAIVRLPGERQRDDDSQQ